MVYLSDIEPMQVCCSVFCGSLSSMAGNSPLCENRWHGTETDRNDVRFLKQFTSGISGTGYATPKRQRRSDRRGRTQNRSTGIGNTGSRDSRHWFLAFLAAIDIPHACGELASRLFFW